MLLCNIYYPYKGLLNWDSDNKEAGTLYEKSVEPETKIVKSYPIFIIKSVKDLTKLILTLDSLFKNRQRCLIQHMF